MAARWQLAGGEAMLKMFSGTPHAFLSLPPEKAESAKEGQEIVKDFLREKVSMGSVKG